MTKLLTFLFGAALAVTQAQAQIDEAARQRSRQALDAAMERARSQSAATAKEKTASANPRGVQYEELRSMQSVDPAELAGQYKDLIKATKSSGPDLLVFVSTSMPVPTLVKLAQQVKQVGGVMVFRGIKGGLTKKALNDWLGLVKPVAATGASMQIDPESFDRYNVNAVPTFVIAVAGEGGCGTTQCATDGAALAGDVSLDYALEKFSARGGPHAKVADSYLSKLARK